MSNIAILPAFPRPSTNNGNRFSTPAQEGMDTRTWLTGMALQGYAMNGTHPQDAGRKAVRAADEALMNLENPPRLGES